MNRKYQESRIRSMNRDSVYSGIETDKRREKRLRPVALEEDDQMALAQLLNLVKINGRPLCWCHVPNGGWRHPATAARLKAMGAKAGVPDILIFDVPPIVEMWSDPTCNDWKIGAAIELKRVGGRKETDEQSKWLSGLESIGWVVAVCYGLDEAIAKLKEWGYMRNETN